MNFFLKFLPRQPVGAYILKLIHKNKVELNFNLSSFSDLQILMHTNLRKLENKYYKMKELTKSTSSKCLLFDYHLTSQISLSFDLVP